MGGNAHGEIAERPGPASANNRGRVQVCSARVPSAKRAECQRAIAQ